MVTPLDAQLLNGLRLGLEGEHQYVNAALAISLCFTWLKRTGHVGDIYLEQTVSFKKYIFFYLFLLYLIAEVILYLHEGQVARAVHKRFN